MYGNKYDNDLNINRIQEESNDYLYIFKTNC